MSRKKTIEEFIEQANSIHNFKYTYEKSEYVNGKTKLIISCVIHVDFKQTPDTHLRGSGCPECNDTKRTTREFIDLANKAHIFRYLYHKSIYTHSHYKLIITCKEHIDFEQIASDHLRGSGCPKCKGKNKTTAEFINQANKVHALRYLYNKSIYTKSNNKIIITCKEHKDFEQIAGDHLRGQGCPTCANNQRRSTKEFIEQSTLKHGKIYNYNEVEYVNCETKVKIGCEKHGFFYQTPMHHKIHGCFDCGKEQTRKTTQKFIMQACAVHGYKYNYKKSVYVNCKTKLTINCPKHIDFEQTPSNHLRGQGCPKCNLSKGEILIFKALKKENVQFKTQHTFDDCIYRRKLIFDFAIFINDKVGLIEFQGEQHFRVIPHFQGSKIIDRFAEIKIRDKIKQKYTKDNGINLLAINYDQKENIEELVNNFIKELS